jgi:hypothetical protein
VGWARVTRGLQRTPGVERIVRPHAASRDSALRAACRSGRALRWLSGNGWRAGARRARGAQLRRQRAQRGRSRGVPRRRVQPRRRVVVWAMSCVCAPRRATLAPKASSLGGSAESNEHSAWPRGMTYVMKHAARSMLRAA